MKARRRSGEAGVTLVEILVVLSIIAITSGAVMLRLGLGRSDDTLTSTAQTMALAVTQGSDQALSSGQDRVLMIADQAYALQPANTDPVWTALPGLTLTRADAATDPLRLAADGTSAPFALVLAQAGRSVTITFDGLTARPGQVTP
jgi:general secretion pathway protein H